MGNNKYKILIVEDEANIRSFIKANLETSDYQTLCAETCALGMMMYASYHPNLIVLDLGLPDRDGLSLIRDVREADTVPIIVLSARSGEMDKVEALDLGANDYITKPFNILEVKARIKAIMRRTAASEPKEENSKVIESGDLKLDCESRRLFVQGREINLTAKEFDLLELLVMNPNKVYSRENLLNLVWGYEYPGDVRTVDVHVRRLREKIEPNPSEPKYVHTKWGVGYFYQK